MTRRAQWDRIPGKAKGKARAKARRVSRANEFRCWTCGARFSAYAPAERCADSHGGGRIESYPPLVERGPDASIPDPETTGGP